jgi:hypothetical protein
MTRNEVNMKVRKPTYHGIKFWSPGPSAELKDIKDFEAQYGVRLASDYYDFLLNVNGGVPDPSSFNTSDRAHAVKDWVDEFMFVESATKPVPIRLRSSTIQALIQTWSTALADDLVPIGYVSRDSLMCIVTRGGRAGEIDVIDWQVLGPHAMQHGLTLNGTEKSRSRIATCFSELLAMLGPAD